MATLAMNFKYDNRIAQTASYISQNSILDSSEQFVATLASTQNCIIRDSAGHTKQKSHKIDWKLINFIAFIIVVLDALICCNCKGCFKIVSGNCLACPPPLVLGGSLCQQVSTECGELLSGEQFPACDKYYSLQCKPVTCIQRSSATRKQAIGNSGFWNSQFRIKNSPSLSHLRSSQSPDIKSVQQSENKDISEFYQLGFQVEQLIWQESGYTNLQLINIFEVFSNQDQQYKENSQSHQPLTQRIKIYKMIFESSIAIIEIVFRVCANQIETKLIPIRRQPIVSLVIYKVSPSQFQLNQEMISQCPAINQAVELVQPNLVSCIVQLTSELNLQNNFQIKNQVVYLRNGNLQKIESFVSISKNDHIVKLISIDFEESQTIAGRMLVSSLKILPSIENNLEYKLTAFVTTNKKIQINNQTSFFSMRNSVLIKGSIVGKAFNQFKLKYSQPIRDDEIEEVNYLINNTVIIFEVSSKKHNPQNTIDYFTFLYDKKSTNFQLIDVSKLNGLDRTTFERNLHDQNLVLKLDDTANKILSDYVKLDSFYDPQAILVSVKIFSKAENSKLYQFKYYFSPNLNYPFEFIDFRYESQIGNSIVNSKGRIIYPQESFISISATKWEMLYSLESFIDGNILPRRQQTWNLLEANISIDRWQTFRVVLCLPNSTRLRYHISMSQPEQTYLLSVVKISQQASAFSLLDQFNLSNPTQVQKSLDFAQIVPFSGSLLANRAPEQVKNQISLLELKSIITRSIPTIPIQNISNVTIVDRVGLMSLVQTYTVDFVISGTHNETKPARLVFEVATKRMNKNSNKTNIQNESSPVVNKKLPNGLSNTIYATASGVPSTGLIIPDSIIDASFRDTANKTAVAMPEYWVTLSFRMSLSNPDYSTYLSENISVVEDRTVQQIKKLYPDCGYTVVVLSEKKLQLNLNISVIEFVLVSTNTNNLYGTKKSVKAWVTNADKQIMQLQYLNEGYQDDSQFNPAFKQQYQYYMAYIQFDIYLILSKKGPLSYPNSSDSFLSFRQKQYGDQIMIQTYYELDNNLFKYVIFSFNKSATAWATDSISIIEKRAYINGINEIRQKLHKVRLNLVQTLRNSPQFVNISNEISKVYKINFTDEGILSYQSLKILKQQIHIVVYNTSQTIYQFNVTYLPMEKSSAWLNANIVYDPDNSNDKAQSDWVKITRVYPRSVKTNLVPGCKRISNISTKCAECQANLLIKKDGQCYPIISNCLVGSGNLCLACAPGFNLNNYDCI